MKFKKGDIIKHRINEDDRIRLITCTKVRTYQVISLNGTLGNIKLSRKFALNKKYIETNYYLLTDIFREEL